MPELIFEIGVEELPALSIEPAISFMKTFLTEGLKDLRLSSSPVETFGTPRRLVVLIDDLAKKQTDLKEEVLGPSASIAFDAAGNLSKAGLGFIKAKGINEADVFRKKTDKGEVIAAVRNEAGRSTKDLLPPLLLEMMRAIPFKKRMRWDASGESFARPISWMILLFDGECLPVSFANVASGKESRGHRFMSPAPFVVTSKQQYLKELAARFVVLSFEEREAMFTKDAQKKLLPLNARFEFDVELMAMVRNLVEYPFVILGSFEESYLKIPSEILVSEMKTHQKCFAVRDNEGHLLSNFICSAATKPYDEEAFAKGNARVLRARFEDGAFYFAEDQKKPLREHAEGLSSLVFERELGTMADKVMRIEKAALKLAEAFGVSPHEIELIKRASPLIKADLVTGVVGQFPELQGVMGRIYAGLDGESIEVCEIIETHYWPRFADDLLPRLKAAALISIADKMDTLLGIIAIGKRPTGNKDPFALRRSAIGIVRMIINFGLSIDIEQMIKLSLFAYGDRFKAKEDGIIKEANEFILQRARGLLIDELGKEGKEYAVNFADSVLAVGDQDLLDAFARAHTLHAMRNESPADFDSLAQAIKRASNIVKKALESGLQISPGAAKESLLSSPAESELLSAIAETKALLGKDIDRRAGFDGLRSAYFEIFSHIALIKPKLAAFFDNVMVMVDDHKLRDARLALLNELKNVADKVADFTHL